MNFNVFIQQYIDYKIASYNIYEQFYNLTPEQKRIFIDKISKYNMEVFWKKIIITTLLYPNDSFLYQKLGRNLLCNDMDQILIDNNINKKLLNCKRLEFQIMNYAKIFEEDIFSCINYDNFPEKCDDICFEYLKANNFDKIKKLTK